VSGFDTDLPAKSRNDRPRASAQRDYVLLFVNGKRHEVRGSDAFLNLAEFLRARLAMTGTKVVCEEGDCGSCSVLLGRPEAGKFSYRVIDSCIAFVYQLDACHVVTVEGLRWNNELTPVQESMVACHGSQCGFCTPGFVVTLTGLLESNGRLTERTARDGLTGNLCRCTGYSPILDAARQIDSAAHKPLDHHYPDQAMLDAIAIVAESDVAVEHQNGNGKLAMFAPRDIKSVVQLRQAYPSARLVAGATDIGVQVNKRIIEPETVISLNRIDELEAIEVTGKAIIAGARATWTDLAEVCRKRLPEFCAIISIFGAPQIRNMGTIGGNIANASPISDGLPFLYVTESVLELTGGGGMRRVNINDFYRGYKDFDLRSDELITKVVIPLPTSDTHMGLYKVSRRRDLDIATFTAALSVRLRGNEVRAASIAFGAVGPTVIRARRTESFLVGRKFTIETMQLAGDVAVDEISPQSDVRGSADFRYQLTQNILLKFFYETSANLVLGKT
jgi:xanthine dehydrogenase small subunit